jgi:glycine dehydrogenase subunit 1
MATIYLATMGKRGVQEVASQNLQKAHYAASQIAKLDGYRLEFSAPFFNEFVVRCPRRASETTRKLLEKRIVAGMALEYYYPDMPDSLLVCVSETASRAAIDDLVANLASVAR